MGHWFLVNWQRKRQMEVKAMDVHLSLSNALINRKSCRSYKPYEITDTEIDLFKWAANQAPHASPHRHYELICVKDQITKNKICAACMDQKYVSDCSVVMVFCGTEEDKTLRQGHPKYVFDSAAACMCSDLMAVSMGYQTVWIGNFIPESVKKILNTDLRPTIILLVGKQT